MTKKATVAILCATFSAALPLFAQEAMEFHPETNVVQELKAGGDYMAASRQTHEVVATGNVYAVAGAIRFNSNEIHLNPDGTAEFGDPAQLTTCSNDLDHLHYKIRGNVHYEDKRSVVIKDAWLYMWDIPCFWVPYWYYPMNTDYGFRFMPGWTSRWGAYLLSGYVYNIVNECTDRPSLGGSTYLDLRQKNGVAVGQTLRWNLGALGKGKIRGYYLNDDDYDRYIRNSIHSSRNWVSDIDRDRYSISLEHNADFTERDSFRLQSTYVSDSTVISDFLNNRMRRYTATPINQAVYEHRENSHDFGVTVSGPVNRFYAGVARLPEFWYDVMPQPIFTLPLNYESQSRAGYLNRQNAKLGYADRAFRYQIADWADYQCFRFDSQHRITLPFKVWDDMVSIVPRAGYRATWYSDSGTASYDPLGKRLHNYHATGDSIYRGIYEAGFTISGRGTKWISDSWRHMVEPYLDYSYQGVHSEYQGSSRKSRIFYYDNLDGSYDWQDQFGFDGRGLPYEWHGIRPGIRNVFQSRDQKGILRTVLETDLYAAFQFNGNDSTKFGYKGPDGRRSFDQTKPNYDNGTVVPGFLIRYRPTKDVMIRTRTEFDTENNHLAYCDIALVHRFDERFSWYVDYIERDYRLFDYSDVENLRTAESWNYYRTSIGEVGFTHELCDAIAWSPYVRWDFRHNDLDEIGTWVELRTDCLAFRFSISYDSAYLRMDGTKHDSGVNCGFIVYPRAFGSAGLDRFNNL